MRLLTWRKGTLFEDSFAVVMRELSIVAAVAALGRPHCTPSAARRFSESASYFEFTLMSDATMMENVADRKKTRKAAMTVVYTMHPRAAKTL